MINKSSFYAILWTTLTIGSISAQEALPTWELQTPESENRNYIARDFVRLKPGFSYKSTLGKKFHATTNPCLLFPSANDTYIDSNGNIVTDPLQGSVVGKIPGEINVNASGGTTYTIPISCPAGIQGMNPNLSLAYNSQAGNGIAGWGWNINGISMITRTGKNYYYDNERDNITWDKDCPLALDGQRLIPIYSSNDSIEYRTENDISNRIVGYDLTDWGPRKFKIYQKNGNILEYGNPTSISSYFPISSGSPSGSNSWIHNIGWALCQITDPNHNFIEYTYNTQCIFPESGSSYSFKNTHLASVTYGHNEQGTYQTVATITFSYDTKSTSVPVGYMNGESVVNDIYLKNITISKGTTPIQKLDVYELTYKIDENNYYLTGLKRTNVTGETFLPLQFEWGEISYSQKSSEKISFQSSPQIAKYMNEKYYICNFMKHWGDIDGDGVHDAVVEVRFEKSPSDSYRPCLWVVYRNNGYNNFIFLEEGDLIWNNPKTLLLLDLDNDGKDEFYLGNVIGYTYTLSCYKYQNSKLIASPKNDVVIPISQDTYNLRNELYVLPNDFLGNGHIQFLVCSSHKFHEFSESGVLIDQNIRFDNFFVTDINGNGKPEIMNIDGDYTTFYEYSKTYNSFRSIYATSSFNKNDMIYVGDFNGDGNTDILRYWYKSYSRWEFYLSNGIELQQNDWIKGILGMQISKFDIAVFDVNQDGISDLFVQDVINEFTPHTHKLYVSTGNGFIKKLEIPNAQYYRFLTYGKFNKSLSKDLLLESIRDVQPYYYTFCENSTFQKLVKIKNAYEDSYTIRYKNTKSPFTPSVQMNVETNLLTSLSADFEVTNQITGPSFNKTYSFTNPLVHKQGKGFFGFKNFQVRDNILQQIFEQEQEMNTQYFITYPKKRQSKTLGGTLISETENSYRFYPNGKRFYLQLQTEKTTDYLTGTSITNEYSRYDADNNPQTIVTKYGTDLTEKQEIKYDQKGAWCYNKISEVVTTRSKPNTPDYIRIKNYTYDNKGNLLSTTTDPNTPFTYTKTYSDYDPFGNPRSISIQTKDEIRTTSVAYSPSGRFVTRKTNHWLNETISYDYDETKCLLLSETSRLGTTNYQYDNFGRLVKTISPDKIETMSQWKWAAGNGPEGAVFYKYSEVSGQSPVTIWYDGLNRKLRTDFFGLNSKKIFTNTEYNSKGLVYRISEPYFEGGSKIWQTTNTYDIYGRPQNIVTPFGTTTYSYNGLTTQISAPNQNTKITKNAIGETTTQVTNGKAVNFTYYASGAIKSATPEGGKSVTMEYDLIGNRTKLVDPDAGTITNSYNTWGEMIQELQYIHTSSPPIITKNTYQNGLLINMSRGSEITNYTYDSHNRPTDISIAGKHSQSFAYGPFDRMISVTETIEGGKTFVTKTDYDSFGRVKALVYPSNYTTNNRYDAFGNLIDITDSKGNLCWQAIQSNARGQMTKIKQGNQETDFTYDERGLPSSISAANIINMQYLFNDKGNLEHREDRLTGQKEYFTYDNMNRLANWTISKNGITQKDNSISYNSETGNITAKSDIGYNLNYGENGKPHALTSIDGLPGTLSTAPQNITYTDFKKIKTINEQTRSLVLAYGVDEQRRKSVFTDDTYSLTRYYLGNYEEEINSSGEIRKIHYIGGSNGSATIFIQNGGKDSVYYAYCDYQGSLLALTDQYGNVKERYAYDPWGTRRNPLAWHETDNRPFRNLILNRGYTMHEHLDDFRLINMNGRVYDPVLAMFLSPDPFIQTPDNWLNYNRYG